jgi:Zn-dependent protease
LRFFRNNPMVVLLIFYMAWQSLNSGRFNNPGAWFMSMLTTIPAIIIGLSFHEFAHAKAADMLGDDTPRNQGRVTLNPLAHIDPIGIIALLFIGFGWGKPVQINPYNFKKRRRDSLIVDLSGVATNLILAVLFTAILSLLKPFQMEYFNYIVLGGEMTIGYLITEMVLAIISINIVLMVFNLLPIPPLDGFGVITEIFNLRKTNFYYKIYDKGFLILMVLIIFNVISRILVPTVSFIYKFLLQSFGIFS